MARQDTRLESEGAEFLVLGQLLIAGIPTYKTYTNMPGYDLVATNPNRNSAARISVKSRWRTRAEGFIINRFDCDLVVLVKLNRGSKDGRAEVRPPEFFVLPVEVIRDLPRSGWGKLAFSAIHELERYRDRWDFVREFLDSVGNDASLPDPRRTRQATPAIKGGAVTAGASDPRGAETRKPSPRKNPVR